MCDLTLTSTLGYVTLTLTPGLTLNLNPQVLQGRAAAACGQAVPAHA